MGENPIRKLVVAWGYRKGGPAVAIRSWGFRCPECGIENTVHSYSGVSHTRKGAKDLFYRHYKKEHAGSG